MAGEGWPRYIAMSNTLPVCGRVLFLANVPWNFVWQRHQTLAALWGRSAQVDYVELPGVRTPGWRDAGRLVRRAWELWRTRRSSSKAASLPPGVRVYRPWVVPASGPIMCALNERLVGHALRRWPELRGPYDWAVAYSPARTTHQWLDRVAAGGVLFDCTDDLPSVQGVPAFFAEDERRLLARADITWVPSEVLLARKASAARRIAHLPHGAWVERFLLPEDTTLATPTTLVYFGHLHRQHLDFEALDRLARDRPDWRLVLAGPIRSGWPWPGNVELPGQVPHERLRQLVAPAAALLLPYSLNKYTEAVMPAKTYECLATGLPVVATPLPALRAACGELIDYVEPGAPWAPVVARAIAEHNSNRARARRERAISNSWESRFAEGMELLASLRMRSRQ
jgi:glycosyltransferase involved in cell wall biosynthesis